jgi:hypothetical protein
MMQARMDELCVVSLCRDEQPARALPPPIMVSQNQILNGCISVWSVDNGVRAVSMRVDVDWTGSSGQVGLLYPPKLRC